jgi:CRISPR-associated protein Csm2
MPDNRQQNRHGQGQRHGQSQTQQQTEDNTVKECKQKIEQFKSSGLNNLSGDDLVDISSKMGGYLSRILKTTQIRRFLDGIRKLDSQFDRGNNFNKDLVILMKPKLAYAVGRNQDIKPLMEVLEPAITAGAKTYNDFKKLVALIEGIVAYHRYHGGRDS